MTPGTKHLRYAPIIDLLRCAAALMVACFHLFASWPHIMVPVEVFTSYPDNSAYNSIFYFGFIGVQIFFVISGFVIAASCHAHKPRAFFVGRALRILPLLWVITAISATVLIAAGAPFAPTVKAAVKSMLLWPRVGWLDNVVWTLVVECVFYGLVWGCLIIGSNIDHALRRLALVLLTISAAFNTFSLAIGYVGSFLPTLLLARHGAYFALGIAIWAGSQKLDGFRPIALLAIPVCILEIFLLMEQYNAELPLAEHLSFILPAGVWLIALAVIQIGARRTSDSVAPQLRTAGLITYPIYLAHSTIGAAAVAAASSAGLSMEASVITGLLVVALFSWLLVGVIEPLLKPGFRTGLEMLAGLLDLRGRWRARRTAS